jgi:hypothetical protein
MHFNLGGGAKENSVAIFRRRWRWHRGHHMWLAGVEANTEKTPHEEAFEIDRCACLGVVRAGACRDGNAGVGGSERVLPPGHHVRNALLQLYQPGAMSGDVRRSRGQLLPGSIPDRRQQRPGLSTKVFPRQKRDTPRQDAGWESIRHGKRKFLPPIGKTRDAIQRRSYPSLDCFVGLGKGPQLLMSTIP